MRLLVKSLAGDGNFEKTPNCLCLGALSAHPASESRIIKRPASRGSNSIQDLVLRTGKVCGEPVGENFFNSVWKPK